MTRIADEFIDSYRTQFTELTNDECEDTISESVVNGNPQVCITLPSPTFHEDMMSVTWFYEDDSTDECDRVEIRVNGDLRCTMPGNPGIYGLAVIANGIACILAE